jgi:hypothetical protein
MVYDHGCDDIYINELDYFLCQYNNTVNYILDPLVLQYIDYSIIQYHMFQEDFMKEAYSYWKIELDDVDPYHYYIPTDRNLQTMRSGKGNRIESLLDQTTIKIINDLCKKYRTTTHNIVLSFFILLIQQLTGVENTAISSVNQNRYTKELVPLIGHFMNTVPYVCKLESNMDLYDIIKITTNSVLNTTKYGIVPLNTITNLLNIKDEPYLTPYSLTSFTEIPSSFHFEEQRLYQTKYNFGDNTIWHNIAQFDFKMYVIKYDSDILIIMEYLEDIYDKETIDFWFGKLNQLINTIQTDLTINFN